MLKDAEAGSRQGTSDLNDMDAIGDGFVEKFRAEKDAAVYRFRQRPPAFARLARTGSQRDGSGNDR
jgi:hypothetical protein